MKPLFRAAFALLAGALLAACATGPTAPPRTAWVPDDAWWIAASAGGGNLRTKDDKLRYVPAAQARNLREAYLAIAKQSRMTPSLALVDSDELNAFATSNAGQPMIAVTLGLFA